jgi:general stress protein 26
VTDLNQDPTELRERLWKELKDARVVMLGLVGGQPHHMQPMAAFPDKEGETIWFFTQRDSDLIADTGAGHDAMVCLMAKDLEFQACLHGVLAPDHNTGMIERYWSPFVSAWYPKGKDDPNLSLARFEPNNARVWISNLGPFTYPLEIIKANATHKRPDVGGRADLPM